MVADGECAVIDRNGKETLELTERNYIRRERSLALSWFERSSRVSTLTDETTLQTPTLDYARTAPIHAIPSAAAVHR